MAAGCPIRSPWRSDRGSLRRNPLSGLVDGNLAPPEPGCFSSIVKNRSSDVMGRRGPKQSGRVMSDGSRSGTGDFGRGRSGLTYPRPRAKTSQGFHDPHLQSITPEHACPPWEDRNASTVRAVVPPSKSASPTRFGSTNPSPQNKSNTSSSGSCSFRIAPDDFPISLAARGEAGPSTVTSPPSAVVRRMPPPAGARR